MSANWQRTVAQTLTNYSRDVVPRVMRNRKLTAVIEGNGRVMTNVGGKDFEWRVFNNELSSLDTYEDMAVQPFQRINRYTVAKIYWKSYAATDGFSKMEDLQNQGDAALIKISTEMGENLMKDFTERFADELYLDGYATGNTDRLTGIQSMFGGSYSSGKLFTAGDEYAGLNTALQYYGGTWTSGVNTAWPFGKGDHKYDFWTPLLLNPNASDWGAGTDNWANNCEEVLRFAIDGCARNSSAEGMPDMIYCDRSHYHDLKNSVDDKQRIVVDRSRQKNILVSLGFSDTLEFDGTMVTTEFGIPQTSSATDARQTYGINSKQIKLMSMQSDLFHMDGPTYYPERKFTRISVDFFGNMCFTSPRYFFNIRVP